MERIRILKPAEWLRPYVRCYLERVAAKPSGGKGHPVPARSSMMIEFVFTDPFAVHWCQRPLVETTPQATLIGLQSHRRVRLVVNSALQTFCIIFLPTGLSRLFRIPAEDITNHDFDAAAVIGPWVAKLYQRLGECLSFEERCVVANQRLLPFCEVTAANDAISLIASKTLFHAGQIRVAGLAEQAGLGVRQFERRFKSHVGMNPKLYGRIARFEAALDNKARCPEKTWTVIAHEFGYHDQMHLIHDFKEFASETPSAILTELERTYGAYLEAAWRGRLTKVGAVEQRVLL